MPPNSILLTLTCVLLVAGCDQDCWHFGDEDEVEIVVTFEDGTPAERIEEIVADVPAMIVRWGGSNFVTIEIPRPGKMCSALRYLKRQEEVATAIPNFSLTY